MDLTGITNVNEYYTNHYFSAIFSGNAEETIKNWAEKAKTQDERTPWALLRDCGRLYEIAHDRAQRQRFESRLQTSTRELADAYLNALGYTPAEPFAVERTEGFSIPVYLEIKKTGGAPLLWVLLAQTDDPEDNLLNGQVFRAADDQEAASGLPLQNEALVGQIFFNLPEAPRWILLIGLNQIILLDRNKWNEKRCLLFDLDTIFSRREPTTFQAMAVLLHRESLCPQEGTPLLDTLDENSHKHAAGVSQDLKYALRESIELLGNEVLYDLSQRGIDPYHGPQKVDAAALTLECLRYMYRMLFVLFIEARPELGYAPMKSQVYAQGYSLESLRDVADSVREDISEVGEGSFLNETISGLFEMIYKGYPKNAEKLKQLSSDPSKREIFTMDPLKAHIFDPAYTPLLTGARLRNHVLLRVIDLMSLTRENGRAGQRGRISYAALGINQLGSVYEALLSYRGFIAETDLYEVKRAADSFDELVVGYFVPESELGQYAEDERVRYTDAERRGKLRMYRQGSFIYRLAGRERETSASYYTPEVLTQCLVKYALKELLKERSADEILSLTICEPAMGSAAFLNEAVNQLAEAYLERKQRELGQSIPQGERTQELQRVKMFIADRNVYGIDLNPVAVELAEVSLWLNTIYQGGRVPWFGTQLVNGNSLIGARRQCYNVKQLSANRAPGRWFDAAPQRIPPGGTRDAEKQVYHFLLGDPGMADYNDAVIKSLAPEKIKQIKAWRTEFLKPCSGDEIATLLRLSSCIDRLWDKQLQLRREVRDETSDPLNIFGHTEGEETERTTIREKDTIFHRLYKTEAMQNAGPYARLKFAMDYWCALWFWPIEQADLLPERSRFLLDMALILEGGVLSVSGVQPNLFPNAKEALTEKMIQRFDTSDLQPVNLNVLCEKTPELALVRQLTASHHFLHWELEFADVFMDRGGFDLLLGNPPWIKVQWEEKNLLAEKNPRFVIHNLSAPEIVRQRADALQDAQTREAYFSEYEQTDGTKSFLNAEENYPLLKGQQTNLFKCFLPQAWVFGNSSAVSGFLHPDSVYDDPNGSILRRKLYPKLRYHFHFSNEKRLFSDVHHSKYFSINIYGSEKRISFDSISTLFDADTIEKCYELSVPYEVPGIKDEDGKWETRGHPDRIIHVSETELRLFAKVLENSQDWEGAKLPALHARQQLDVLECFAAQPQTIGDWDNEICTTVMWDETNRQKDGTIRRDVHFPESALESIISGPHIYVANPVYKTSRRNCTVNSDYDPIDLTSLSETYLQRCNYSPACDLDTYINRVPVTPWGEKYSQSYRLVSRKMLNLSGERTLVSAIIPPDVGHIIFLFGASIKESASLVEISACLQSLPYDYYVKASGRASFLKDTLYSLPYYQEILPKSALIRVLLLNCLTMDYAKLWQECWNDIYALESWAKEDYRVPNNVFASLSPKWSWQTPLRTDYARRQALVELDVLVAMALGMTLDDLRTIYRLQFPVLYANEKDTWYDQNGRIVFTCSKGLPGVGYSRPEWETIKDAKSGTFTRTITDDTLPDGPHERTIEYLAPFDRCDREQDYETAWAFFEAKYGKPERPKLVPQTEKHTPIKNSQPRKSALKPPETIDQPIPRPVFGQPIKKPRQSPLVPKLSKEEKDGQLTLSDWSLYRCAECGALVPGFSRQDHLRDVHGGKDVEWEKLNDR